MNETAFTPLTGLLGGALIGVASVGLLLASGRIAGISGILGRSIFPAAGDLAWRLAFVVGLPIGAWLIGVLAPASRALAITPSAPRLVAGGLLVGIGTQMANGCTSGHGICGLARGSRRSLLATAVFMAAGMATTFVARHVIGAP